jgi:hypothetical protein
MNTFSFDGRLGKFFGWFTAGEGWDAVFRVTVALAAIVLVTSLALLSAASLTAASLAGRLASPPAQQDPVPVKAAEPEVKVLSFIVGDPTFFTEPTWGISGQPTVEIPVIVGNVSDAPYDVSPFQCFSASQAGRELRQIIPPGGRVSPGGIVTPNGGMSGWLYFEGIDGAAPVTLTARCEDGHTGFTATTPKT